MRTISTLVYTHQVHYHHPTFAHIVRTPLSATSWPEGLCPSQSVLLGGMRASDQGMGFGVRQDSASL